MRSLSACLMVALCISCRPSPVARTGFVVTSYESARYGFTPGDTLAEALLDTLPLALRLAWEKLRLDSAGNRDCARAFVGDSFTYIYEPPVCGREPSGDEWLRESNQATLRFDGSIRDTALKGRLVGVLCPLGRGPEGRPYFGTLWRLDGCFRWPYDVPDSLLPSGTVTALGVILPHAVTRGLLDQCSREVPDRADFEWEPSIAAIDTLERALPAFLAVADSEIATRLSKYNRQYGGFGVGQDSLIYVSFGIAWDSTRKGPGLKTADTVCDGGRGYFGVVYDPKTRRFSQLAFNGTA